MPAVPGLVDVGPHQSAAHGSSRRSVLAMKSAGFPSAYRRDWGGLAAEFSLALGVQRLLRPPGGLALDGDAAPEGEAVDDDVRAAWLAIAGRARVVECSHQAEAIDLDVGVF